MTWPPSPLQMIDMVGLCLGLPLHLYYSSVVLIPFFLLLFFIFIFSSVMVNLRCALVVLTQEICELVVIMWWLILYDAVTFLVSLHIHV